MTNCIFTGYSGGENRITDTIFSVIESMSLPIFEKLLGVLTGQPNIKFISMYPQPKDGKGSVPDYTIKSNFNIIVETKIAQKAIKQEQLEKHISQLSNNKSSYFVILTPDENMPIEIQELSINHSDININWISFIDLSVAINKILIEEIVSEREIFLLKNLNRLFDDNKLFDSGIDRVVVIAAGLAYGEYIKYGAYICQNKRYFKPSSHLAFYCNNVIMEFVPKIVAKFEDVKISSEANYNNVPIKYRNKIAAIVKAILNDIESNPNYPRKNDDYQSIFLLSAPDSKDTLKLGRPIENDMTSSGGRRTAFTQGQRYIHLAKLNEAIEKIKKGENIKTSYFSKDNDNSV